MNKSLLTYLLIAAINCNFFAQKLKPGFEKNEYLELLKIAQKQALDTSR